MRFAHLLISRIATPKFFIFNFKLLTSMKSRQPDYILLTVIGILVVFGLIMISSASVALSQEKYQESYHYLKSQLVRGVLPGLALALIAYFIPYQFWRKLALPLLIIAVAGLILVFFPGVGLEYGGAKRWLRIASVSFQPSELLKLPLIIYLAAWLASKEKEIKSLAGGLVPFVILVGLVCLLILLEPDLGTVGVIGLTSLFIFILAGARISHILLIIVSAAILGFLLIKLNWFPHATNRVQTLLNPELDPQGIGYQINQALLALGSGGFFGLGLGQSLQKFRYLPQPASDSIAAVIGEELGFLGLLCLLLLFVIFAFRGFKIARQAPDNFGRLLAGGITGWIIFQTLINIAAISGLIPLTGITLPFISFGGSSLAITLAAMGILLNISKYSTK
ncbi:MAG: cell division protein FtsW [Parcubacteria group bacterium LiPW_39]|nr:MAG: cell division protein FtsW [Parcubacteria group bacterium LiPW_39]